MTRATPVRAADCSGLITNPHLHPLHRPQTPKSNLKPTCDVWFCIACFWCVYVTHSRTHTPTEQCVYVSYYAHTISTKQIHWTLSLSQKIPDIKLLPNLWPSAWLLSSANEYAWMGVSFCSSVLPSIGHWHRYHLAVHPLTFSLLFPCKHTRCLRFWIFNSIKGESQWLWTQANQVGSSPLVFNFWDDEKSKAAWKQCPLWTRLHQVKLRQLRQSLVCLIKSRITRALLD